MKGMIPLAKGGRVPAFNTYDVQEVTDAFMDGAEDLLDEESTKSVLIEPADNYAVPTITNHIAEIKKVLIEESEKALIGDESVEDAMKTADERSSVILNK